MISGRQSFHLQLLLAVAFAICGFGLAFGQEAARPDRGTMPNRTYSVSDIENISLQNGNVNLSIPLAALPPIAGGKLSWVVKAQYNSKLWNVTRMQQDDPNDLEWHPYVVDTPQLSDLGGWAGGALAGWLSGGYRIQFRNSDEDFARQWYPDNSGLPYQELQWLNQNQWWKIVLITPDGAEHELRPTDFNGDAYPGSQDFLRGYYRVKPTGSPMRYYSVDGTFLFATISSNLDWTVYMPDGTRIIHTLDGIQRIQDTNGNKIKFFTDTEGSHIQDEQTGRELKITYDPSANGGQGQSRVWYQTVNGGWHQIDLNWGTTTVQGKVYRVSDWYPSGGETGGGVVCERHEVLATTQMTILREIVFPQTEPGQPQRKFTFDYNSDATVSATESAMQWACGMPAENYNRQASLGWGELSQMETPSGSLVDYSYDLDGEHSLQPFGVTDYLTYQSITEKKITHDGTFDIWSYSIGETIGSVSNPDGTGVSESRYCSTPQTPGCSTDKAGLVYRSSRAFMMNERHWTNLQFSGAHINSPGGILAFNPVMDAEYTTLLDGNNQPLKMSAKTFQYDYNGNVTQAIEYDWFDPNAPGCTVNRDAQGVPTGVPGCATALRVTDNSQYNQAASPTSGNVYANRSVSTGAPLILNAPRETITGPARAQFSYDGQAYDIPPTVGNLTSKSVWDDLDNKWITTSSTYGLYGNLATSTDARGKVTQFFYDDATHALPNRVVVDPQNGTGTQTTTAEFDYSTGLVTATVDANGKRSEIDYTNQLLNAIDPFGRPGVTIGPDIGGGVNHRTRTFYEDSTRTVTVLSDLNTEGDGLLKSQTISDMLGRTIESRRYETASDFIAVRKSYDPPNRVEKTSNPFRAGDAVVWTTITTDLLGRVISVTTPDNAAVTTSYHANFTTVTDQANKQRRSMVDALGRLIRVDEPDKVTGNLDDGNGLPIQPTSYTYDVLGNLRMVSQGTQSRYFMYDSLSRLIRARNPEQATLPALDLADSSTGNSHWSFGYAYDDNGNLTSKTDARGVVSTYGYDALNRNISISYSDGTPSVGRAYDGATNGKGRFWYHWTSAADTSKNAHTAIDVYDALGRAKNWRQHFWVNGTWGTAYSMSSTYNLAGHIASMTYPSGRTVTNTYDGAGRLNSFVGNLGDGTERTYATNISYSPFGGMSWEKYGTTAPLYHKTYYNIRGQMFDTRVSSVNDTWDWNRGRLIFYYSSNHQWGASGTDNNGNVRFSEHWIPPPNATLDQAQYLIEQSYDYDKLNRLSAVSEQTRDIAVNGSWTPSFTQSYGYDRWGNRSISSASGGVNNLQTWIDPSTNRLYALTDQNISDPEERLIRYDAAGNQKYDAYTGQGTRVYDAENRMTGAQASSPASYGYDADGHRVKRSIGTTETWQVYGIGGELIAEYAANASPSSPQKEYGYRNGELLITATVTTGSGGSAFAFTDNPVVAETTTVKAIHVTELRTAVNQARARANLSSATWTDEPVQATVTAIKAVHITELRSRLDEARAALGLSTANYTDPTLISGYQIKAAHVQELRTKTNEALTTGAGTSLDLRWLVTDQLGTPRMVFDQTGSLATVSRHDYLPFGEELFAGTGGRTTAQGYTASDNVRQKFTQKERDIETGLDYFGARYYSSQQGRFTSVDPSRKSIIPTNPQTWNRYSYTYNNPLVMVDNNGKWPTGTHKEIIEKAFRTLDPKLVRHIQRGSEMVDRLGASPRTLYEKNAPQHAMTPGYKVRELGSVEKAREWARNEATNFINSNMAQAKEYYEKSNQADREVTKQLFTVGAFEAFGKGAHPIMDGPAPGHHDFQVYDTQGYKLLGALSPLLGAGVFGVDMLVHSNAEGRKPTDAEMNQMVDDLRMQFLNAFGREAYEQAVPEADRKETDERKRKQRQ